MDFSGGFRRSPFDEAGLEYAPSIKYHLETAPDFTVKMKNRTVDEGSYVKMMCSVTGIPSPDIRWFKDGEEIFDGDHFHIKVWF